MRLQDARSPGLRAFTNLGSMVYIEMVTDQPRSNIRPVRDRNKEETSRARPTTSDRNLTVALVPPDWLKFPRTMPRVVLVR